MPRYHVVVGCKVPKTFRAKQVAGMFDLKMEAKASQTFDVEVPAVDDDWQIGVIVGPSGSGKTSVAREVFGDALYREDPSSWPHDKAVVDGFGDADIRQVTQMLTAVGFSSPPAWIKPYQVLSNGERFRCDLARALLIDQPLVAVDEFTSVVDRTVAKFGSAAVAKAIRSGHITHNNTARKFVAVTCHYDVLKWLEADWVLDMASGVLTRRRLRRPPIELEIAPIHHSAWQIFRQHHYLNTSILSAARCWVAFWKDQPVGFSAWVHRVTPGAKATWQMREHRTVILPDYQGLGIGNRLSAFCASIFTAAGGQAFSTTSHPAMIRHRSNSPNWHRHRLSMVSPPGRTTSKVTQLKATLSVARLTGGFKYVGPPADPELARDHLDHKPAIFRPDPEALELLALISRYPGCTTTVLRRHWRRSPGSLPRLLDQLERCDLVTRCAMHRGSSRRVIYPRKS